MAQVTNIKVDTTPISKLIELIKDEFNPVSIWLFGSRARGTWNNESDWDLLVVVPDQTSEEIIEDPLLACRLRRSSKVHADIIACKQSDFRNGSETLNTLSYEAFHNGILIYEQ